MAKLIVTPMTSVGDGGFSVTPAYGVGVPSDTLATEEITIGGTSVQSAVFPEGVLLVRLMVDAPCWLAFGDNPVAAAPPDGMPFGGDPIKSPDAAQVEYFGVIPGQRLAVVTRTT